VLVHEEDAGGSPLASIRFGVRPLRVDAELLGVLVTAEDRI